MTNHKKLIDLMRHLSGKFLPFLNYVQEVDTECNNSVLHLGICLGFLNTMENIQSYRSYLLRCHTSREQRLILTRSSA